MIPNSPRDLERRALDGEVHAGRRVRDSVGPADMRCDLQRLLAAAAGACGGAGVVCWCHLRMSCHYSMLVRYCWLGGR